MRRWRPVGSGTTFERAVGEVRPGRDRRKDPGPWLSLDEGALKAKVEAGLAGLDRPPRLTARS